MASEQTVARNQGRPGRDFVSVVVATGAGRRAFLRQLLRCWESQSLDSGALELVVVDDCPDGEGARICAGRTGVRHVALAAPTILGDKLNVGCAAARGDVLAKWDDDDWYGPGFLEIALAALRLRPAGRGLVLWGEYLVLLARDGTLHTTGPGHKAGNTLTFDRALWAERPFRPVPRGVDSAFLEDHPDWGAVDAPDSVVVVRHGANTWTEFRGIEVDPYVADHLELWHAPLVDVVGSDAAAFYAGLAARPTGQSSQGHPDQQERARP